MHRIFHWVPAVLAIWIGSNAAAAGPGAPPATTFYVSTFGGFSAPINPEFEDPLQTGELGTELGFVGGVAFGTNLTDRLRAEVELAVHQNDVDEVKLDGFGSFPINADITVVTSMVKLAYDFELGPFQPYVAAGIGAARYEMSLEPSASGSDQKTVLAGEIEGGMIIPLTEQLDLFTSTRLIVLKSFYLDPTGTGGAELQNPLLLSSSLGLRIGF